MNKIININLAGRLIPIDEPAYEQLNIYIERLKVFFLREQGGSEIVRDMEDRIGELFQEKLKKGKGSITETDVQEMIAIMGRPEQIENETAEETVTGGGQNEEKAQEAGPAPVSGRLSRSERDKVIGGVCGGIAMHFNIDPAIVRIVFVLLTLCFGVSVVFYLLLWALLPPSHEAPKGLKRRLFRDPEHKIVSGVCGGLASYFGIDPIIPRLVFVAPLLALIFFGVLDHTFFIFPVSVSGLPTMALLYVILWTSLPQASTVAEKLEMRGEKVDVSNLSQAIRKDNNQASASVSKSRGGVAQAFSLLLKIGLYFVLGIVVIVLTVVIIGLFCALFGMAVSVSVLSPMTSLLIDNDITRWILWISAALLLIIPVVWLVRTIIYLVTGGRRRAPRWEKITSFVLFSCGLFGLVSVAGHIIDEFRVPYTVTGTQVLQPAGDTLIIERNRSGALAFEDYDIGDREAGIRFPDNAAMAISNISLNITPSADTSCHLVITRSAYGKNQSQAQKLADHINLQYRQEGRTLYLPLDFEIPEGDVFRAQQIDLELQLPKGMVYRLEDIPASYFTRRRFKVRKYGIWYLEENYPLRKSGNYYRTGDPLPEIKEYNED